MTNSRLVYIVEDDAAVRRSTAFMLQHEGYQVRPIESGVAFMELAKKADRGCVLLDIRMPEMDGLEVQREMKKQGVDMPVVVLTGHGDMGIAVQAIRAGAINFLEKPYEKEELLASMEPALERLENKELKEMESSEAKVRLACLTGRERDVLDRLLVGNPNKTIADDLGISPRNVEICRANMMEKLRVRSLAEALRIGFAVEAN